MSASLVGSEMCIRDSHLPRCCARDLSLRRGDRSSPPGPDRSQQMGTNACLLYTSDAADDM
eukprot:2390089-Alexandrium_andersonii.AAC.1